MKKYHLIYMFISLAIVTACDENTTEPDKNFTVSGNIVSDGHAVENATVSLNNNAYFTTRTNSDGYFLISDVPKGEYTMKVEKINLNGSFTTKTSNIFVFDDLFISSLLLPKAVRLYDPFEVQTHSMIISWSPTDANDFREYKLYSHTTSGLDENTGTLVHVSTAINDTQFTAKELTPLTDYYFRVYMMNDYGRMGGSNIVTSSTTQENLIWNGDFELKTDLLNWWRFWGIEYTFDHNVKHEGEYSLMLHADTTIAPHTYNVIEGAALYKHFNSSEISVEYGRTYLLSGWIKTEGNTKFGYGKPIDADLGGPNKQAAVYFFVGGDAIQIICPANTDWTYFEDTNVINESNGYGSIFLVNICEYAWFDDVKITLVK